MTSTEKSDIVLDYNHLKITRSKPCISQIVIHSSELSRMVTCTIDLPNHGAAIEVHGNDLLHAIERAQRIIAVFATDYQLGDES